MATFLPIKDTKVAIDNTPIVDGQFLMTTDLGVGNSIYLDNGTQRINMSNKTATFTPSVSAGGVISWTNDKELDNPEPVNIKGNPGDPGTPGSNGTTFTPSVDASGNLSWTNDGGKENPSTKNIKGPAGQDLVNQGEIITPTDGTVTLAMIPNKQYIINGAVSSLTLTAQSGYNPWDEFYVLFVTSASGCTVTPPTGWIYVEGSTSSFDANKVYELNVKSGLIVCPPGTAVGA